jgi:catechol 1,2-dioxygenase
MQEKKSRRQFLRWLGAAPGAALLLGSASCGAAASPAGDVDSGRSTRGSGGADAGIDGEGTLCMPTGKDVRGPFHARGAPERNVLADEGEPGERLVIEGTVMNEDCEPLAGVLLDVWHADHQGQYHEAGTEYRLRGQMLTDPRGMFRFETIRPGNYPLSGSMRPAHIHFMVSKPGWSALTTQLYFAGDRYLAPNDPCGRTCNSGDPTQIIALERVKETAPWEGTFDIVLTRA